MGRSRLIFLFSGQGSQYYGMGRALYEKVPGFRARINDLDRVAADLLGVSVWETVCEPPQGRVFDRTLYTHPALFMVQFALAQTLADQGLCPDLMMGASLGEIVALALAGVLKPDQAMAALIGHARDVEAVCQPGAMVGVAGSLELLEKKPWIRQVSSLACVCCRRYFVLAGDKEGMTRVVRDLEGERRILYELPVRYGFHSPNILPAQALWQGRVQERFGLGSKVPAIQTISCLLGQVTDQVDGTHLVEIPRAPILFPQAAAALAREIQRMTLERETVNLLDLGPGGTTLGFLRQQACFGKEVRTFRVLVGDEIRNFEKLKKEWIG